VTTRRLATMLADRPAHCCEEPQFGVDMSRSRMRAAKVRVATGTSTDWTKPIRRSACQFRGDVLGAGHRVTYWQVG